MSETKLKIWSCKIGEVDASLLPDGADLPMRQAVRQAYLDLTGRHDVFCFSGWGATLDESERAVVEKRAPSAEYERQWLMKRAAPDLYAAAAALTSAMKKLIHEGIDRGKGHWPAWDDCARAVDKANAALSKAEGQS